jgi:hypothetical protein
MRRHYQIGRSTLSRSGTLASRILSVSPSPGDAGLAARGSRVNGFKAAPRSGMLSTSPWIE